MKILHDFISRMRSTAVVRISNTVRARSATAVGEAKIQTPSDRLNTQERADYALVSDFLKYFETKRVSRLHQDFVY